MLDEPITYLDMPTIFTLGYALREYDGAVILVTHDRFFMRYVVEGKPFADESSKGSGSDDVDSEDEFKLYGRRILYEIKVGKVTEKESIN